MVIICTAFSEGSRENGREEKGHIKKKRAKTEREQVTAEFSLQHVPSWQITGNCNFAAIAMN